MTALKIAPIDERPSAEIYKVTPAVAKRWLSRNVRNRTISQTTVDAYARDMAAGAWQVTGEAVKFDTNGALADGQHRLTAVVQSGATVPMLVVRGLAPDAQRVMDSGKKRTASDALTLGGVKNACIIAAAARLALREPGAGFTSERISAPTNSEIADFIEEHPEIHHAAEMASHYHPAFDAPPSVLTLCWMRFAAIDLFACAQFFIAVADMQTEGAGDPRLALIRRLANARRNRERLDAPAYLSLIFRAWNASRRGKSLNKLLTESHGGTVAIPSRLA